MKPASGQIPDQLPDAQIAPERLRNKVSSKFIRREAAAMASDAKHAAVVSQRFSLLRTRVLREMRNRGWSRLAVVPVTPGAGGTYVAVHLSLALARQPHTQVALIDLNLGNPGVAEMLGIPGCGPVSAALSAGRDLDGLVVSLAESPNLSALAPARPENGAAELLQDKVLLDAMQRLHESHPAEVAILDTAALLSADAALASLPLADALLLVADGRNGTAADMRECERLLVGMPPVMGIVLNKAEG
ncbi:chromosome partitioning protein [Paracoccus halophilus]|uniref:Chromosome partitioning protein n=2 Tax=Paracoccus halophilus TaxID=376733 RepID=A0A099EWN5_9RHOB|nr:chromosome partitioning protein [Paracoccus halophilus]KGJ02367.1 chromosome partitioning protein [Paracoccus halophilus]